MKKNVNNKICKMILGCLVMGITLIIPVINSNAGEVPPAEGKFYVTDIKITDPTTNTLANYLNGDYFHPMSSYHMFQISNESLATTVALEYTIKESDLEGNLINPQQYTSAITLNDNDHITEHKITLTSGFLDFVTVGVLRAPSSNSKLKSLEIDNMILTPAFDENITEYTAVIPEGMSRAVFSVTTQHPKAKVAELSDVEFTKKNNVVNILVTAQDQSVSTYKITMSYPDMNVVVIDGKANVEKASFGDVVTITADKKEGYEFLKWVSDDIIVDDVNLKQTTFTMGNKSVELRAIYTYTGEDKQDNNENKKENEKNISPKTGDNSMNFFFIALMALCTPVSYAAYKKCK